MPMNESSLGARGRLNVDNRDWPIVTAGEYVRPRLPEPSGPPAVPPGHPMADFYRPVCSRSFGPARYAFGPNPAQSCEKIFEGAIMSTLALVDMAITVASMAGVEAGDE